MNQKDYYQILGIENGATQKEVKQAYRKLAFQYHPDKNSDNAAADEKTKEINQAYAVLANPVKSGMETWLMITSDRHIHRRIFLKVQTSTKNLMN
jgi:preprotein translocase subunit Sec63